MQFEMPSRHFGLKHLSLVGCLWAAFVAFYTPSTALANKPSSDRLPVVDGQLVTQTAALDTARQ